MRVDVQTSGAIGPDHWFAQAWAAALAEVTEALEMGENAHPLAVRAGPIEPGKWAQWPKPLWHAQEWTPGSEARLWIGCDSTVPRALWRRIGGDEEDEEDRQALETFGEMLNQSAAGAAAEVRSRLGVAVEATPVERTAEPEIGWAFELHFVTGGVAQAIVIVGNPSMAQVLNPPAVKQAPAPRAAAPMRESDGQADPLDLIREVSMELAVSFGDTTMPLANVLELASGAIIELNRSVSDPVEVLANGSVIARGDVVVVDGNYGVRITEIVSRRDRVRSML